MYCYQCEQTAKETACTSFGVCGKDPDTAVLQDLIIHGLKGVSMYAHRARALGAKDRSLDVLALESLFLTVTNVNFDISRHVAWIQKLDTGRAQAREMYETACKAKGKTPETLSGPATLVFEKDQASLIRQAETLTLDKKISQRGEDLVGLESLVLFGLKGLASYMEHAQVLGQHDDEVYAFCHEVMDFLSTPQSVDALTGMALKVGEVNLKVMGLLDHGHTSHYGHPEPTQVRITPVKGKAILVTGHDLKDLEELLKQTEDKGINIYTHGEMLPAHAYPKLKAYKHLVGNYGGAWQDQRTEFESFPGAIVATTNCIQKPKESYKKRFFTRSVVGWPGVCHLSNRDFSPAIEMALVESGFSEDAAAETITIGFAHHTVLSHAEKVLEAVQKGDLKHFYLIGGCDGAKSGRNYFTEFAEATPKDSIILTLGCGKYRFNKLAFGEVAGLPRLMDMGQCNDAYSAIQVAVALSKALNVSVNELPLSLIVSWFEQKAVAVLLTLLHLGIKNIRLGPSLPAFVSPAVLNVLVEKFNLMPVRSVQADLAAIAN